MKKILLAIPLVFGSLLASAQAPVFPPDGYIRQILEDRNIKYEVLSGSDNEFRIATDLGNGRSQTGFIDSRVHTFSGYEFRDVLSLVLVSDEMPSRSTLYEILEANEKLEMGFFEMFHNGMSYVVRYKCRVAANLSPGKLLDVFYYGITVADELEKIVARGEDEE